jgi:F-type H+-transporting ATPase subunit delta
MKTGLVAREYARVLTHFTEGEGAGIGLFLRSVGTAAAATPAIRHFLSHPAIPKEEKVKVLIGAAAPTTFGPVVGRVLLDLIKRGATSLFGDIADEMDRLADEKSNIRHIDVTSAAPLSPAAQAELIAALSTYTGGGVKAQFKTEPALLSGMLIKIGGTIIDNTMKMDIDHIREQLSAVSTT